MAQKIQSVKGMNDLLPVEQKDFKLTAAFWQAFEDVVGRWTRAYGYQQIRLPMVEQTNLFKRSIGDATDIVEKEMYTFLDKGNPPESLTLRPEGTAGCVRAMLEHNLKHIENSLPHLAELALGGTCHACPARGFTLQMRLEAEIRRLCPDVRAVRTA